MPVDRYGRVDPDQLDAAITDRTTLVTIMLANNEVGSIQPIAEIARRVRGHKGVLAVDAVQGAPYIDLDVRALDIDLLSIPPTSSRVPRGSARCSSATERTSSAQQQGGEQEQHRRAEPRTSPPPSAWRLPTSSHATSGPRP